MERRPVSAKASALLRRRVAIEAEQYDAWRASLGAVKVTLTNPFLPSVRLADFPDSIGEWPVSGDDLALAKAGVIA
jgi:hypothetical protein